MKRTQVQIPEPLYREIERVARQQEWSITEVMRRGAEYMVRCYPSDKERPEVWRPPTGRRLGEFLAPVQRWRELANEPDLPSPRR